LQLPGITKEFTVLALYGTNGLTAEHKKAIKDLQQLEENVFFFDGDRSGKHAIEKYKTEFTELLPEITLSIAETPGGEDVNSLHQMYDNEAYFLELLEERVRLNQTNNLFLLSEETEEPQIKSEPIPITSKAKEINTNLFGTM